MAACGQIRSVQQFGGPTICRTGEVEWPVMVDSEGVAEHFSIV
jgi:hypothetical protein